MREAGIDIGGHESKTLDRYLGEPFDVAVTVCGDANDACPVVPGARHRRPWPIVDPFRVDGSDAERLAAFRRARRTAQADRGRCAAGGAAPVLSPLGAPEGGRPAHRRDPVDVLAWWSARSSSPRAGAGDVVDAGGGPGAVAGTGRPGVAGGGRRGRPGGPRGLTLGAVAGHCASAAGAGIGAGGGKARNGRGEKCSGEGSDRREARGQRVGATTRRGACRASAGRGRGGRHSTVAKRCDGRTAGSAGDAGVGDGDDEDGDDEEGRRGRGLATVGGEKVGEEGRRQGSDASDESGRVGCCVAGCFGSLLVAVLLVRC